MEPNDLLAAGSLSSLAYWPGVFLIASLLAAAGGAASVYARHEIKHADDLESPPVDERMLKRNIFIGWFFGCAFAIGGVIVGYNSVEWIWGLACVGGYLNKETAGPIGTALYRLVLNLPAKK